MARAGGWMNWHVIDTRDTGRFTVGAMEGKSEPTVRKLMKRLRSLFPGSEFKMESNRSRVKWILERPKRGKW